MARNIAPALLLSAALLASCSNDESDEKANPDARYVVAARIFPADDGPATSYLHVVESLDASNTLSTDTALELGGSAKLFAIPQHNWFAVGSGEEPTITRYTLENGKLEAGKAISLQPYGVTDLWDTLYVVSPTKAYYPDRANAQLIIINPKDMSVDGKIDLIDTAREGYLALYGYEPVVRDGKLLITVGWFDWNDDRVLPETGLVEIDTEQDLLANFNVDARCGGVTRPITLDSGDSYLVSSALAAAADLAGRPSNKPCALRIRKGANQLDPDYALDLTTLSGGAAVGEPVPSDGKHILLRVLDDSLLSGELDASWKVTGQEAWSWWSWDVAGESAARIEALPFSTSDVAWFTVDGNTVGSETTADYSETKLIDLQDPSAPKTLLTVPGFASGIAHFSE